MSVAKSISTFRLGRLRPLLYVVLSWLLIDGVILLNRDTWERHSPDDYAERLRGCRKQAHDFVVVGGSPVSEGIDPDRITGVRWRGKELNDGYAIGLPGGTTTDAFHAIRNGCPSPPSLVIYGISASDLNDARNEPHGAYSVMGWRDWAECVRDRPDVRGWMTRRFLEGQLRQCWAVFQYRHGIRMWAAMTADEVVPGCCPEAVAEAKERLGYSTALRNGNGYAPASWFVKRRYDFMKADGWVAPPFEYLHKYRTGSHLTYLHKLADWCEAHGATLILLDMPVTADLEARHPDEIAEYQQRLAEFRVARQVTVLHATRESIGLSDGEFADLIHLNVVGAIRLSHWLRDRIAEQGLLNGKGGRP